MANIKKYKEFKQIFENDNLKKSVSGLGKFGMIDFSELPDPVKNAALEAGLHYEGSIGLDSFGIKNYTNGHPGDDSLHVTVGMTYYDQNDIFNNDSFVTVYASSDYNELGFTILDTYDNYDRVLSFLNNYKEIIDPINEKLLGDKSWGSSDFIMRIITKKLEEYDIKGDGLIIH